VNLFGASFVVKYDPQQLRVANVSQGDFLGANLPIWFTNVDSSAGKVSIGMSRAGVPDGVSGAGALAILRLRLASSASIGSITQIGIEDVAANDPSGNPIELVAQGTDIVVAVEDEKTTPARFALMQNYPNPFNAGTTIAYALPQEGSVLLIIYNMLGQMVRKLIDENQTPGHKRVLWDGNDERGLRVSSGVYFYRIEFGQQRLIGRMILQQ
jgi:hypothetical protein